MVFSFFLTKPISGIEPKAIQPRVFFRRDATRRGERTGIPLVQIPNDDDPAQLSSGELPALADNFCWLAALGSSVRMRSINRVVEYASEYEIPFEPPDIIVDVLGDWYG